jgi:riboflavin synthase
MFTGIVEEIGRIDRIEPAPALTRLRVRAERALDGTRVGDSIAVDGACLTVVDLDAAGFWVEATPETLRRTSLGDLASGDGVHLERALAATGRVGGHFVQGHVDAAGTIQDRHAEGDSVVATFTAPPEVMRYVVPKGSIAIDGVSLTIVDVHDGAPGGAGEFTVALIPHTQQATLLCAKPIGARVNLEADILAKYVARTAAFDSAHNRP